MGAAGGGCCCNSGEPTGVMMRGELGIALWTQRARSDNDEPTQFTRARSSTCAGWRLLVGGAGTLIGVIGPVGNYAARRSSAVSRGAHSTAPRHLRVAWRANHGRQRAAGATASVESAAAARAKRNKTKQNRHRHAPAGRGRHHRRWQVRVAGRRRHGRRLQRAGEKHARADDDDASCCVRDRRCRCRRRRWDCSG